MSLTPVTVLLNATGKRLQPTINFGLPKCRSTDEAKDHISKLPDDVIVSILSLLELKEAARTSVLSNRWRYVWTSTRSLDFDDFFMLRMVYWKPIEESYPILRRRFIDFVNKVLKSHRSPTIDEFMISFDVDDKECYKFEIENWIKFALKKRVNRLTLGLQCCYGQFIRGHYALTTQFLGNCRLDSIKSLRLNTVDVTEEVLDYLLSHCPSLELLSILVSKSLVNLKVSGPSLRLKHLEIRRFRRLKNIEISDINLVFFKYSGVANVHFKDVPQLAELSLNGNCALSLLRDRWQFSTLLSKLKTLVLSLRSLDCARDVRFLKFPELTNLRKLDFTLESCWARDILWGTSLLMVLLEVSPLLHTLVLHVDGLQETDIPSWKELIELNKVQKANGPHQCLKLFKLGRFVGCEIDIKIAVDIFTVAVSLEKIIIDTSYYDCGNPDKKSAARTRARQLETTLPLGAQLVIL